MIRAGAYLTLAWAVLMGPSLCCCSTQGYWPSQADPVGSMEPACPHCAATAPAVEPTSPCTQDPSSPDCPICELVKMKPAWGTVPSVVASDLDLSFWVPAFDLVLGEANPSIGLIRSHLFFHSGPFTHLNGVGILRACSRLQC